MNYTITKPGLTLLERLTVNERRVFFALIEIQALGKITAHTTQDELALNIGLHIGSLRRAYRFLVEKNIITTVGHGRVCINPRFMYRGTFQNEGNVGLYDKVRKSQQEVIDAKRDSNRVFGEEEFDVEV